ncbi:uncharacterized protein GGS22DRAFT_46647 [Annulohypoxylon maeteangense]|uniref:uncharacterized protein n=1 Tax=Annulohypoxylon maeteangense TaxID=1927788 RepID=UPI0020089F44|nr:uncharacterized protein GGS22DRAFT_46647 [Annulohypoxylon maeteangense]KAI0882591.1 hypothetical protein GGS22DRAFT_46647 [Annulohypoxylon maeteangense]
MTRLLPILATAFGLASAQGNYPNQSAPFNLVISSSNSTLNGQKLSACHSGAAVESLCLDSSITTPQFQTFYFNGTAQETTSPGFLPSGLITWTFTGGVPEFTSNTAMQFFYNAASNLAFPLIWPSADNAQPVSFTDEGLLAVGANVNDAVSPPKPFENNVEYLTDRWAICVTYWQSYGYTALQYVMGNKEPQNPSCQLVTVKRVYL